MKKMKLMLVTLGIIMIGSVAYVPANTSAASLQTTGSPKSYADSRATTELYWSNTQGNCRLTANVKLTNASVAVSLGGMYTTNSQSNLLPGKQIKATKDVGYRTTVLYGTSAY